MVIEDIQRVVTEFIKRVQLPESNYTLSQNTDNNFIEFKIAIDDKLYYCLSIDNGSLRVLYSDGYTSDKYYTQTFTSPIMLLYELCIIFYSAICNTVEMTFNDLLTVVLLNEITNWKELVVALAENLGISAHTENDVAVIDDLTIEYNESIGRLSFGSNEFELEQDSYTSLVEGIFSVVEYVANLQDKADSLFSSNNENIIEDDKTIPEEDMDANLSIDDSDIDSEAMDDLIEGGEGEEIPDVDSVPASDMETFEAPQEAVITPDMV